jgi:hypothetical protein
MSYLDNSRYIAERNKAKKLCTKCRTSRREQKAIFDLQQDKERKQCVKDGKSHYEQRFNFRRDASCQLCYTIQE